MEDQKPGLALQPGLALNHDFTIVREGLNQKLESENVRSWRHVE